jgi:hypothetical protein
MSTRGAILVIVTAGILGCGGPGPSQTASPGSVAPTPSSQASLGQPSQPGASEISSPTASGKGSIVYISVFNVWVAAPDGTRARQVTTDGTEADPYHDPSQSDDSTVFVLKGSSAMHRFNHAGRSLAAPVTLPSLENGAEGLAASPDGARAAYATVGSGTYVDPRFGTPSGTFLYGGTDIANLDGNSVDGAVLVSLLFPSWVDNSHLLASDGVDLFFDEVGPAEPTTWLSLDDGCVTDFDCPPDQEASASVSTPAVSGDGHVLSYTYGPYFGPAGRRLATVTAAPSAPETRCVMTGQEHHSDTGTFSADGSVFVYDDTRFDPDEFETVVGQGIWHLTVDLDAPDCGASTARLIVEGGSQPDWGPAAP